MKKSNGFTLTELLIVLALIGIVTAMALPAFDDIRASNRMMTTVNDIVGTFHQARSEAITRARNVTVEACRPDCGSTGTQGWENGWRIVTVDNNGVPCTDDDSCATRPPLHPGIAVTATVNTYMFDSQGRLDSAGTFDLCDHRPSGRQITVSRIGRAFVEEDSIVCP